MKCFTVFRFLDTDKDRFVPLCENLVIEVYKVYNNGVSSFCALDISLKANLTMSTTSNSALARFFKGFQDFALTRKFLAKNFG